MFAYFKGFDEQCSVSFVELVEGAANADAQSRQLFESLIGDEERHQNQYEREQENIRRFGPSYLALQAMQKASEPSAEPKP